jgi:midasin
MIELHRIGSDLLMLTNAKSTDESQLHVYGEILRCWLSNIENVPELDTLGSLMKTISKFSTNLELGRGNSMTRIWESYRGRFPTTGERWDLYEKVLQLSSKFDSCSAKLFPDSVEWIESLRDNIVVIMSEVLSTTDLKALEDAVGVSELLLWIDNDGTNIVLQKIESGVQKLETLEERFQTQRTHLFHDIFYIITLCLEVAVVEGESDVSFWFGTCTVIAANRSFRRVN